MSRRTFIESNGATCRNWTWSWSFVNVEERFVIFGEWDVYAEGSRAVIFDEAWARSAKGRRCPGYGQSREHLRLVEEDGYSIKTFPMIYSKEREGSDGIGPATIAGFLPELRDRHLVREGQTWYAV